MHADYFLFVVNISFSFQVQHHEKSSKKIEHKLNKSLEKTIQTL
jgi:hypothetical protein